MYLEKTKDTDKLEKLGELKIEESPRIKQEINDQDSIKKDYEKLKNK